jgi:thiamine transporter
MSKEKEKDNTQSISTTRILTEAGLMLAVGTVLSLVKILDLPYGGSVTVAAMLPVILIAYRHGIKWGLITGLAFAIIRQLLGLKNLSYVTTWQSVLAVIFLDYIIAYTVLGFAGIFRKFIKSQPAALVAGTILVCFLRYACHVLSGATVWAGLSIPDGAALIYSIGYNLTYMLPETVVTAIMAFYIGSLLDFRNPTIKHMKQTEKTKVPMLKWTGGLAIAAALIFDVRMIFANLQNPDTGKFDFSGLASTNWMLILIVTVVCAIIATATLTLAHFKQQKKALEEAKGEK